MRATILRAGPETPTALDMKLGDAFASTWPGEAPEVLRQSVAQLLLRGAEPDPLRCPLDEAVLMIVTRGMDVHEVDRALDAMQDIGMGVVVAAEDVARWTPWRNQGVIVADINSDPTLIASMLFALCSRQGFVSGLMREVSILQRCQAGVRAEVERIHEELHLAAGVQHEFTASTMPELERHSMSVLYRPVNTVSGDIYNVRMLDEETVAFFLADAVGHGVPAALLTMILTNSLITADQCQVDKSGVPLRLEPSEVVERLNRRLVEGSLQTGRFATGLYGTLNIRTGELVVAGAGHPAPMILGEDGVRELQTEGPLLGVFADADFDQVSAVLKPGETLLLYTDGLEAAFPKLRVAGGSGSGGGHVLPPPHVQQLTTLFKNHEDATTCMGQLEVMLDEQSGSLHQADDITVLAITAQRRAMEQRLAA
jgi:phosphoserine phosphatase RsbU/P